MPTFVNYKPNYRSGTNSAPYTLRYNLAYSLKTMCACCYCLTSSVYFDLLLSGCARVRLNRGFHILNQVAFFGAANMADWLAECLQVGFDKDM